MAERRPKALSWQLVDGTVELQLHRAPCNEIGTTMLAELEQFVAALDELRDDAHAMIVYSGLDAGFCAGADLRELYAGMQEVSALERIDAVRAFLHRIHAVMNALDAWPHPTIAAVHGVCFGGGLELALVCDIIVADRMARFCFPELRLGLVPGFGGIPRLKRDIGNGVVRDLLLTGRSLNATRAHAVGLVGQLVSEGNALKVARTTAAQVGKFDRTTAAAAKEFIKPIPHAELQREIELFCELLARPAVEEALRKFVQSNEVQPYLP
ncbi:MAG: enoyl-CoA hydratase/isomerase family protein [Candidatus Latescibacterota bacterium]|nr:MAG: enoyl-CoA hydratase/isomerase family protein [Candidatus Latescibacterota bacterium]